MIELNVMLLVQLGNFLLTLIFLNYLLIRPIRRAISAREEKMAKMLAEADEFSQKAEERLAKYEEALNRARAEAGVKCAELKEQGLSEETRLMEAAAGEAHESLMRAREAIATEAQAAMADFKNKIDDLARQATQRMLA